MKLPRSVYQNMLTTTWNHPDRRGQSSAYNIATLSYSQNTRKRAASNPCDLERENASFTNAYCFGLQQNPMNKARKVSRDYDVKAQKPDIAFDPELQTRDSIEPANGAFLFDSKMSSSIKDVRVTPCGWHVRPPGVPDIDEIDRINCNANSQYVQQIYKYLREIEIETGISGNYLQMQESITPKMRAILVDWLVEVQTNFEMSDETLFLAVGIVDRYLSRKSVKRGKLQLVGVTAIWMANKYECRSTIRLHEFIECTAHSYTKEEMISMEGVILNALNFRITFPSALTFLQRVLVIHGRLCGEVSPRHRELAHYFLTLALLSTDMLKYRPSLQAVSASRLAVMKIDGVMAWGPVPKHFCGEWGEDEIEKCARELSRLLHVEWRKDKKLLAVNKKFSKGIHERNGLVP